MSHSSILPITLCLSLCVVATGVSAQSNDLEVKPPAIVQDSLDLPSPSTKDTILEGVKKLEIPAPALENRRVQSIIETAPGLREVSLPVQAVAGHVAAVGTFIRKQAIDPTVDAASKSAQWVWVESSGTIQTALAGIGSIGASIAEQSAKVTSSAYWPYNIVDTFVDKMHGEEFVEFSELVNETGFALADIKVGIGIIPDLAVDFVHVRDLSDEEFSKINKLIDEHTSHEGGSLGYVESVILHNLAYAGRYAGNTELSAVRIKLFPLPGLVVKFDPFKHKAHYANKLKSTMELANVVKKAELKLEERLADIEKVISKLKISEDAVEN